MEERRIEVLINGYWYTVKFELLRVGDKFRIFDNGILFMDSYGHTEWTVASLPTPNDNGILYVETEEATA